MSRLCCSFLKSGPWLKRKQVSGLRTQGFKHQHALLKNLKGRPEFGVGVHKGHLVVHFKIDLFLKIGLDKIVEGVLCMKKIANQAPKCSGLKKMLPVRVVRSRSLLEIRLSCKVKKGHVVRSSNFVGPGPDTPIERHYVARIGQSFDLIKTAIDNGIGIADISRPLYCSSTLPRSTFTSGSTASSKHTITRHAAD